MKLPWGNTERNFLKLIFASNFWDITTKSQTTKAKINIATKLWQSKSNNNKKMKRQSIEWDKIFIITYWIKG